MSDPVVEKVAEQPSYLGMSDADIMNAGAPADVVAPKTEEVDEEKEEVVDEAEDTAKTTPDTEDDEVTDDDTGTVAEEGTEVVKDDDTDEDKKKVEKPEKEVTEKVDTKKPVEPPEEAVTPDYEAEYKRILAPFKANGRDIQVKSVDDAISLMQQGANYNKKMAGLKPNLKLMKMLENNGLLDESKLSFLIDLDKKSPDAITKLLKDSGLNPMDLDTEKAEEYKPKIHTVDDREIDLDTVLSEIESTPTYTRTLGIVSKEWDGASKQVIASSPQLLKVINNHVASGVYEIINAEVESERTFGRLNGLSDIEAYRQVGDAIQARGGFNHLGSPQAKPEPKPVVVVPKPKKPDDAKLNEKRRAAGPTKAAAPTVQKEFNPLAMSDDDFKKLASTNYR